MDWSVQLLLSVVISLVGWSLTCHSIIRLGAMFVRAGLSGIDMGKRDNRKIPEAMGLVCGCIYLISSFVFIPVPFSSYLMFNQHDFPHDKFAQLLAGLLSVCCMLLLGFGDDVLELKWRHKLWLPSVASLPLLVVYAVTFNCTLIVVPKPFRFLLGHSIDLGPIYYVYMGMLAVFCTNAINILSGVNGLEVGQSVVIAASISVFNFIEISTAVSNASGVNVDLLDVHLFSLYLLLPFIGVSLALLKYNWYPARVFVGDTYCYFAGMIFAVTAILGHFSKTMMLFFAPQIFNFLYSLPQLLHILPCPRHRLPKYDRELDRLDVSTVSVRLSSLSWLGRLIIQLASCLRLARVSCDRSEGESTVTFNNLTLVNLLLLITGPIHERDVTLSLLVIQVVCSCLAFVVRYPLASLFYDS